MLTCRYLRYKEHLKGLELTKQKALSVFPKSYGTVTRVEIWANEKSRGNTPLRLVFGAFSCASDNVLQQMLANTECWKV